MYLIRSKVAMAFGIASLWGGLTAAPIAGEIVITGGEASVSKLTIDFGNGAGCADFNTADGCFGVSPSTMTTNNAALGSSGVVMDLASPGPNPYVGPVSLDNWMVFAGGGVFKLTNIFAGGGGACVSGSTSCSPYGGPFVLSETTAGNVAVRFEVGVQGYTGDINDGVGTGTGTFTTQLTNTTIAQVLATLDAGGSVSSSYSAEFFLVAPGTNNPVIPEPGTVGMLTAGLVAITLGGLRSRKNRNS